MKIRRLLIIGSLLHVIPARGALLAQVAADSNDPVLLYESGVVLLRQRNTTGARAAFLQAVRIDGKLLPAWIALFRIINGEQFAGPLVLEVRWRGGRPLIVARRVGDSLRFETRSDSLRYMARRVFLLNPLAELTPGTRYPMPYYWKGTLSRAMRALDDRKFEQAVAVFDTVIMRTTRKGKPEAVDPFALWYQAMALLEQRQFDRAIVNLQRLLDRAFRDTTPQGAAEAFTQQYTLAYVNHQAGHLDEAARVYRQLLEDNLGLDIGHSHLADILEQQGKLEDATLERRYARDANPDDPSFVFDLGLALVKTGRGAEAEEVLKESLSANPREVRAYYLLGVAHQLQGESVEARAAWTRFLELAPKRYAPMSNDAQRRMAALQ